MNGCTSSLPKNARSCRSRGSCPSFRASPVGVDPTSRPLRARAQEFIPRRPAHPLPSALRSSLQWWIDALTISPDQRVRSLPANRRLRDRRVHGWYRRLQPVDGQLVRPHSLTEGDRVRVPPQEPPSHQTSRVHQSSAITDNHESAVAVNNRSSKMPKIRHLINFIGITAHRHDISIRARLVPREENWRADLLSKLQVEKFLARTPGASRSAMTPLSVPTLV